MLLIYMIPCPLYLTQIPSLVCFMQSLRKTDGRHAGFHAATTWDALGAQLNVQALPLDNLYTPTAEMYGTVSVISICVIIRAGGKGIFEPFPQIFVSDYSIPYD